MKVMCRRTAARNTLTIPRWPVLLWWSHRELGGKLAKMVVESVVEI